MPGRGRNRGQILEDQLEKSMPAGVYVRKLHTPAPPPARIEGIIGLLTRLARGEDVGWAIAVLNQARFTARQPYDLMVIAPAERRSLDVAGRFSPRPQTYEGAILPLAHPMLDSEGQSMLMLAQPSIVFTLEVKCAGEDKSLNFSMLQPHQEEGLVEAAGMGYVSGLILEFPAVGPVGELYFMPIASYIAYRARASRKSLPLEACRDFGILIEVDQGRGRVHRYWRMGEFFWTFGAAIQGGMPAGWQPASQAPVRERSAPGGKSFFD